MRRANPGETLWTEALVARLSELWLSGTTSGEIGRRLGITRSAVMGKLRRLDMLCRDRRPPPSMRPLIPQMRTNKRPLPPPEPYQAPPPPPLPLIGSFDLLELRHGHCRYRIPPLQRAR
jgi:GcrA cell cycle regulator